MNNTPVSPRTELSVEISLFPVYFKLLLTAFFWGGTFIAGKSLADHVEPFSAAFFRFTIAAFVLLIVTKQQEGRLPQITLAQLPPVILLGLTGVFAYNFFFFKGLQLIEASRASAIIALNPIIITVFSALFFKEKLRLLQVGGIVISVIGALFVITRGDILGFTNGQVGRGEVIIFGCVLSWSTYSLIGKVVMTYLTPLAAVSYSALAGAVCLFPAACFEGMFFKMGHYGIADWASISYLGFFGTAIGFVWFYRGINLIGPTRASQFINFVPISAIGLAFFILDEPLTPSLLIGTITVIAGVYCTNRGHKQRR